MTLRFSSIVSYGILFVYVTYLVGNLFAAVNPLEFVPEAAAGIGAFFVIAAFILSRPFSQPEVKLLLLLLGAYFGVLLISTLVFGNPRVPAWQGFGLDLVLDSKAFVFAFLFLVFLTKEQLLVFFRNFIVATALLSLLNLLFIFHDLFSATNAYGIPLEQRFGISIPTGIFSHKTESAQVQLIAFIGVLAALRGGRYALYRPTLIALTVIFGLSVVIHLSIKEIAAAAITLILFATLRPGRQIGRAAVFGVLAIFLAGSALTFESPIRSAAMNRFDVFLGERGSKAVRTVAYPISAQLAVDHMPLGTGASTFMSKGSRDLAYSPYYVSTGINDLYGGSRRDGRFLMDAFWPKILAQSGFFGLIAFALLILGPIVRSLKMMRREGDSAIFASTAIMISLLIASVAAPVYTDDHLIIPFAISLAFAMKRWQPLAERDY